MSIETTYNNRSCQRNNASKKKEENRRKLNASTGNAVEFLNNGANNVPKKWKAGLVFLSESNAYLVQHFLKQSGRILIVAKKWELDLHMCSKCYWVSSQYINMLHNGIITELVYWHGKGQTGQ